MTQSLLTKHFFEVEFHAEFRTAFLPATASAGGVCGGRGPRCVLNEACLVRLLNVVRVGNEGPSSVCGRLQSWCVDTRVSADSAPKNQRYSWLNFSAETTEVRLCLSSSEYCVSTSGCLILSLILNPSCKGDFQTLQGTLAGGRDGCRTPVRHVHHSHSCIVEAMGVEGTGFWARQQHEHVWRTAGSSL